MKQLTAFRSVLLLSTLLSFQSCTLLRFAYSPSIQNVPAFTEKNESRVTGFIAAPLSGTETNYGLQGAYAITDHFAITAGLNGTGKAEDELTITDGGGGTEIDIVKYKRNSVDFGVGVFYPISKDKKVFFEAYAGYGFGKNKITDLTDNSATYFHNSDINRFYVQPVLSLHPSDIFTLSIPVRFTSIGYTNIQTNYTSNDLDMYLLKAIATKRLNFIEPALVISSGFKAIPWLKLQGQINISLRLGEENVYYRSNYFGIGLQFDLVKAFQKKAD